MGLEAFVLFVNENNPVNELTTQQICDIYAGEIRNWSLVGGANRTINPVTRVSGSGSQTMMERFMGERDICRKSPFAVTGGSIDFSFRYYLDGIIGSESVKTLSLNGVYPSAENIRNGTYPVITQFYAIDRADNDNPNISVLIDWLLSAEGQTIVEESECMAINDTLK